MTWVDAVILAVLAISAVIAYFRGLVHEVLGVGAWVGAFAAALLGQPQLAPLAAKYIQPAWLADAITFGGLFLIVLVVLKLVIAWFARAVQNSALGGLDRALGLLFGIARGAFIIVLIYTVAGPFLPGTERWPEPVRDARALPYVATGAAILVAALPADYRPRLPETAARPAPGMEDLLRPPARNRI